MAETGEGTWAKLVPGALECEARLPMFAHPSADSPESSLLLADLTREKSELMAENALLRQQLIIHVPDLFFRPLFAFFLIELKSRRSALASFDDLSIPFANCEELPHTIP